MAHTISTLPEEGLAERQRLLGLSVSRIEAWRQLGLPTAADVLCLERQGVLSTVEVGHAIRVLKASIQTAVETGFTVQRTQWRRV